MRCFHVVYVSCASSCEWGVVYFVVVVLVVGWVVFFVRGVCGVALFVCRVECFSCVCVGFMCSLSFPAKRLPECRVLLFAVFSPDVVCCVMCWLIFGVYFRSGGGGLLTVVLKFVVYVLLAAGVLGGEFVCSSMVCG